VLAVVYLVYNEGWSASDGDDLVRAELCEEAVRLARLLVELMPDEPEAIGLLALMLLHDARRDARTDATGALVTLEEQDRSLWHRAQIDEGAALVDRSLRMRRVGPYQLQAAIAALHDTAAMAAETDWPQIAALYAELERIQPTAIVALNRAVAIAMSGDIDAALRMIEELEPSLDGYYLLHAARADLLRRQSRVTQSIAAYQRAMALAANDIERAYLQRRIDELSAPAASRD
jgi:RNA polymerase sigma-70 factor (ECF subfamily)